MQEVLTLDFHHFILPSISITIFAFMSTEEKNELKKSSYTEAMRYIDNAKEALQKAKREGKYYTDAKYVRTASGVAYSGMFLALDTLMRIKNIQLPVKSRKSIEWYRDQLRKMDWKLLNEVNTVYSLLHLAGYYEGLTNADVINKGIDSAVTVIKKIKPLMN
ncbi:MAG: DUF5618 family protein [Bacteroidia bacterium]